MSVEMLTYAALGARLKISPEAARALAKRLRLPRSLSRDGKAVVSVDLAEIRHNPRPPSTHQAGNIALLTTKIETLQAEITRARSKGGGSSGRLRARARAGRSPNDRVTPGDCRDHGGQGSDGAA